VEILAQSSADFALTYNFQGTRILGASRGHLSDSVIFLCNSIQHAVCYTIFVIGPLFSHMNISSDVAVVKGWIQDLPGRTVANQ